MRRTGGAVQGMIEMRPVIPAVVMAVLLPLAVLAGGEGDAYAARHKGRFPDKCLEDAKKHLSALEKSDKSAPAARKGLEALVAGGCGDSLIEARLGTLRLDSDPAAARKHFEAASSLAADYPDLKPLAASVLFNLAYLLEKAGDLDGAETRYRGVLDADHGYANARTSLVTLYQKRARARIAVGDATGAIADIDAAIAEADISENQYGMRFRVFREQLAIQAVEILVASKRFDAVDEYLGRFRAEKNTRGILKAAALMNAAGHRTGEEKAYEMAFDTDSTLYEPVILWAELYENAGDLARAEAIYRRALEKNLRLSRVRYALGVVLYNQGRMKEGVAEVEQASSELPTSAEFRETLEEMKAGMR